MANCVYWTKRRVEFSDTDMAGIAHFTNYFRYLEEAEHEFLRSVGLNVVLHDAKGTIGFPKLEAHCVYKSPVAYNAEIQIRMDVCCDDGKTISYDGEIRHKDQLVAEGQIIVACCRFPPNAKPFAIPIPESVLEKIRSSCQ